MVRGLTQNQTKNEISDNSKKINKMESENILKRFKFDSTFDEFIYGHFLNNFSKWTKLMRKDYNKYKNTITNELAKKGIQTKDNLILIFNLYLTFKDFEELSEEEFNKKGCFFTKGLLAKKNVDMDYISFNEISMNYYKTDYVKCWCEWMFQNNTKYDEIYKFVVDIDEIESETSNKETMQTFVNDAINYMKNYPDIKITISGYFKHDNDEDIIEGKNDNVKYMICALKSNKITDENRNNYGEHQTETVKKDVSLHVVFDNVFFNKESQEYYLNRTNSVSYKLFNKYIIDQSIFSEGRKFRSLLSDKINQKKYMQKYVINERYDISLLRNKNFKKEYIPYIHVTNIFEELTIDSISLDNTLLIPYSQTKTQKINAFDKEVKLLKQKQKQTTNRDFEISNTINNNDIDFEDNNTFNEELFNDKKCEEIIDEFKKLYNVYDNQKSIKNMVSVLFDTNIYKYFNSKIIYDFYTKDSGYLLLKYHNLYGSNLGVLLFELMYNFVYHTTDTDVFFGLVKQNLSKTDVIDNYYYSINIIYEIFVLPIVNYCIKKIEEYPNYAEMVFQQTYININKKSEHYINNIKDLLKNKASINIIISIYNKFQSEAIIQFQSHKNKYVKDNPNAEFNDVITDLKNTLKLNECITRLINIISFLITENKHESHDDIFIATKYNVIDVYNKKIPKYYYYFLSFYSTDREVVYYRSLLNNDETKIVLLNTTAGVCKRDTNLNVEDLYAIACTDYYKNDIEEKIFDHSGNIKYMSQKNYYDNKVILMLDKLRSTFCSTYEYELYLYAMQQKIINKTVPINFGFYGGKSSLKTYFSTIFGNMFNSKNYTQILDFPTILGNFNQYALDKYIIIDEFSLVDKKRIIDYIKNIQTQNVTINLKNVKPFTIENRLNIVLNCNADENSLPLNGLLNLDQKSDLEALLKRLCVCKRLSLKEDLTLEEYQLQNDNGFIYAMKMYVKNMKLPKVNFFTRKLNSAEQDLIDQHMMIEQDKKNLEEAIDINPFIYTVLKEQPKDRSWFEIINIDDKIRLAINFSVLSKVYKRITNKPIQNRLYNKSGHIITKNYKKTTIKFHKHTEMFCELIKNIYDIYLVEDDDSECIIE